ncbi:MAG: thymidylate synthase [Sulfitobacter sp.]
MTRLWMGLALGISLSACGSGTAPFGGTTTQTDGSGGGTAGAIPAALAGTVDSFTYNPNSQTLSIQGVEGDNNALNGAYRRRPGLDRVGYQAYTAQDASNGRHSTVYVRDIDGTRAAVVATGVQYQNLYAGGAYSNTSYTPRVQPGSNEPDSGLVYYTGHYVGLLNGPGSSEDLTPPNNGESPSVTTVQAAEITGDMQMTADFATLNVDGIIYNRRLVDFADPATPTVPAALADIALQGTTIAADGTFLGVAEQQNQARGEYGGIFGGTGATAVAGIVHVEDHIDNLTNEEEYGVFVLGECVPPLSGPDCNLTP